MLSTKPKTDVTTFKKEKLSVNIFATRKEMGKYAANDVISKIHDLLAEKDEINIIFASAPSQEEFIEYLLGDQTVEWSRINAFHMDEYIGLEKDAPQGFGNLLKKQLFDKVSFKGIYYINGQVSNVDAECERYTQLLKQYPVDIVCLGIGENGHLAFNDPHVADFHDTQWVKVVNLDIVSCQQQVNENCFSRLHLVPTRAITLTIPALMKAPWIFCLVPATNKAQVVYRTLNNDINEKCPSTILRTKENARLYLDADSTSLLNV